MWSDFFNFRFLVSKMVVKVEKWPKRLFLAIFQLSQTLTAIFEKSNRSEKLGQNNKRAIFADFEPHIMQFWTRKIKISKFPA